MSVRKEVIHLNISETGRIIVPKKIRQKLGITSQSALMAEVSGGVLHLTTTKNVLAEARSLVKRYCNSDVSIVDEFIKEKREEAFREDKKYEKLKRKDEE